MMRRGWLLAFAVGCSGEKDDSDGTDVCNVEITDEVPADGDGEVCAAANIEFEIAGGDPEATISVADSAGNAVDGTTISNDDGTLVTFELGGAMEPNTDYTATLDYCLGTETVSFTTSEVGSGLTDPKSVVGNTYVVDLQAARFVEPVEVGELLQGQLERKILLHVNGATDTELQTTLLVADDGDPVEQDFCVPTIDFPAGAMSEGSWEVGPADVTMVIAGDNVDVQDLDIYGTFAPDGSYFGCGGFTGLVDTRPLVSTFDTDTKKAPEDFLCNLVSNYGAACETCEDGEELCLTLVVDQITSLAEPMKVETVEEENCHALCAASKDNKDCVLK